MITFEIEIFNVSDFLPIERNSAQERGRYCGRNGSPENVGRRSQSFEEKR